MADGARVLWTRTWPGEVVVWLFAETEGRGAQRPLEASSARAGNNSGRRGLVLSPMSCPDYATSIDHHKWRWRRRRRAIDHDGDAVRRQ